MSQDLSYSIDQSYPFPMSTTGSYKTCDISRCMCCCDISGCMCCCNINGLSRSSKKPIYSCCKTFINVYSITEQDIYQGKPILFDTHNSCSGNCYHDEQSADIWIWKSGYYHVSINVYSIESVQFSLVMNNTITIPGTTFGSLTGLSSNNATSIIYISEDDIILESQCSPSGYACKLQVVNNTGYLPYITLYGSTNSVLQNTASFTLMQID